jgi:hypothetical protein
MKRLLSRESPGDSAVWPDHGEGMASVLGVKAGTGLARLLSRCDSLPFAIQLRQSQPLGSRQTIPAVSFARRKLSTIHRSGQPILDLVGLILRTTKPNTQAIGMFESSRKQV